MRLYDSITITHPELVKEWHPFKNSDLTPSDVSRGCERMVWWYLPYDDPKSGKHFEFEWQATVYSRCQGSGCPYLTGRSAWPGYNDISTTHPHLLQYWHPTKNGKILPTNVSYGSNIEVWWCMQYTDPKTNNTYPFEWKNTVKKQAKHNSCPYLVGKAVFAGFNDLLTTHPKLAKQWHPIKNGTLKPSEVSQGSNKKVWWIYPYCDKTTNCSFVFEWEASICNRVKQPQCPYLVGRAIWTGFNDLATMNPNLASEWHPTKNGNLKPTDVMPYTAKKVWWQITALHPVTGDEVLLEWEASVLHRNQGEGCPYLTGTKVLKGFNDFATINPQKALEWHPTKNSNLNPCDILPNSHKMVWWQTKYYNYKTKQTCMYEWSATVANINAGYGCPFISASKSELLIYNLLNRKKIIFEAEKTFVNCVNVRKLKFDYYIPNINIIIETDGIQHFEANSYFGGKKAFNENQKRDNIKNDFCKSQNIPLLRIPYIYDPIVDKDKIEKFVLDFIQTKQVPQEIKDFYAKYSFSNYCK